ncbi:MFS transporter [Nocardia sp. BMG51109]|uniref:MFS transporter n=1 Tax=Nocardia sp. BMG51109 TaxID=1056816 RepID=UPI0009FFBC0B|nr:MFS transporter [Nocardia sp. BMG51109]
MGGLDDSSSRPSFYRFWAAAAISSFGSAVTAAAMPVLVVQVLGATPFEVGVVSAAQFVPYAALGLIAGVYADRWRRKPILVWASIGRALSLGAVPALWLTGLLQIWALVIALLSFGAFSVFGFAATQSLLPRLVPRASLVTANARLDQTDAAATTLGPAIGGGLVGLLGAPVAVAVDAISYVVDAALTVSIRVDEPRPVARARNLRAEIRDGLRWTYRHRTLGPLAVSTHVWFLANGAAMTVLSLLALRSLRFTAYTFGILLAVFGIASLVGASIAPRCGSWIGSGRVIIAARVAYPITWLLVAIAPATDIGAALLFVALVLQGLAAGTENSNEMGFWQTLTPDELLGRVNATRRSINRTIAAFGALIAGILAGQIGNRLTLVCTVVVFAVAALAAALSPLGDAPRAVDDHRHSGLREGTPSH